MLRKIRLTFAMICFALITLLFLDFTGTLHGWFGWLAKIQFLPAVLALNVGVILFLVILTLVCGRIYCSVICPLGVFQDILAWLGRQPKKRRKLPYSYSPALSWLRYGVFIIRKSKFPQNPKRSVRFSGKRTKRSVQKRKARNTQKAETKVL